MVSKRMQEKGRKFVNLAIMGQKWDGSAQFKATWLTTGQSVLRVLAKELQFTHYKVGLTKGGPGVLGEANLLGIWANGKGLYLDTATPAMGMYQDWDSHPQFMWRQVTAKPDAYPIDKLKYGDTLHGTNRWERYDSFDDMMGLADYLWNQTK